jgi:hypothetical protein
MHDAIKNKDQRVEQLSGIDEQDPLGLTQAGSQLDAERSMAEERERLLRAEQDRLDEEQKKIEARRLELEAERKRQAAEVERLRLEAEKEQKRLEAEAEKKRIAERLAQLAERREQERAEQERLEREAELERRRAEEKLQALKLEQERHRSEQERLELEAQREVEEAERRFKELSFTDLPKQPAMDEEEHAVPQFREQPGTSRRIPMAIAAFAVVMIGGVVAWQFMSGATNVPASAMQQTVAAPALQTVQAVSEVPPVTDAELPPLDEQMTNAIPQDTAAAEAPAADVTQGVSERPKRAQTTAVQEKPKKAPAEKQAAPAKKQVTVDDLINDN